MWYFQYETYLTSWSLSWSNFVIKYFKHFEANDIVVSEHTNFRFRPESPDPEPACCWEDGKEVRRTSDQTSTGC